MTRVLCLIGIGDYPLRTFKPVIRVFVMGLSCAVSACGGVQSQSVSVGYPPTEHIAKSRFVERPEQANDAAQSDPKTPLCPKCAILGGLSRAPLGAKVAFVSAFWIVAWGAIFVGLGIDPRWPRRIDFRWLVGGIAIGLMPLFIGIV